jgi:lysyl-tRNA synthetase class 2
MTESTDAPTDAGEHHDENKLIALRREKLGELRQLGQAYPNGFKRTDMAVDLIKQYQHETKESLEEMKISASIAGRMMLKRDMGKASFATLQDMSGQFQMYVRLDAIGAEAYEIFKHSDVGDIFGAEGVVFKTGKGELSLKVSHLQLLTKSLRPLPEKFHGLTDTEQKYRQRYLDLIMNADSRRVFQIRSKTINFIRDYLEGRGYMEVETPMMHIIPGGATARPFVTHHNALDMDLFLRIAPELYLKRLVVGGVEKVFEINRNFRNEGLSTRHNPEFTMIEFYEAYADYHQLMDLTEDMIRQLAQSVLGTTQLTYQGQDFDLGQPFARMTVKESITHFSPDISAEILDDPVLARAEAGKLGIHLEDSWGLGKVQIEIFEKIVEHRLIQPTFITAYPTEVSPLARKNDDDDFVTDRFEFFLGGRELANGFSELNDPEDQAERFRKQVEDKDAGDLEAMHYDEDYIRALEFGLPPTAGEGIGIDRLVMFLTDSPSIRDVLLFPHMRPE